MLRPPDHLDPNDRERILVIGYAGSGKTTGWFNIAQWAHKTGSESKFFVLDTDDSVPRMLTGYPELQGTIEYALVGDYPDAVDALKKFTPLMSPDDWLVVDFVGSLWEMTQEYYVSEMFGAEDMGEFFFDARKKLKGGSPLDGWKDWSVINKLYKSLYARILKAPGHKYLTAVADQVRESDDKAVRQLFGSVGVKPRGQKHLAHSVHTVINLTPFSDEYLMTTLKDRERESMQSVAVKNFAVDYLVKVAGWKL